jgi:hypothetical protein
VQNIQSARTFHHKNLVSKDISIQKFSQQGHCSSKHSDSKAVTVKNIQSAGRFSTNV